MLKLEILVKRVLVLYNSLLQKLIRVLEFINSGDVPSYI